MSDPLHTPTMLLKHSLNIKTPGEKLQEKPRFLPRRLLQDTENDPPPSMISPSKFAMVRQLSFSSRMRLPLEDHDANSQDSGISEDSKSCSEFRFAEPCGAAPRRMPSVDMSPHRLQASPLRSPRFSSMTDISRTSGTPDSSLRPSRCRIPEASPKRSLSFSTDSAASLSSFTSDGTEDGFLDIFQNDKLLDEDAQMPGSGTRLGNLLSAQILTGSTPPRSPQTFHRSMSENISPNKNEIFSLKRPLLVSSHSVDATTPVSKRHKPLSTSQESNLVPPNERGTLFQYGFKRTLAINNAGLLSPPKSITPPPHSPPHSPTSCSDHSIKLAFQRSTTEELIGDYTRPFALPLLSAKEHDLKTISCDTLAGLLRGEFNEAVTSYKIIDCRYPYEYDGGHIKGAVNLYRRDQITHELQSKQRTVATAKATRLAGRVARRSSGSSDATALPEDTRETKEPFDIEASDNDSERHILVFHCEYSAERGPSLFRWLRQEDRAVNLNRYPQLVYPELYLLDGGYRAFFNTYSDLCEPQAYKPMTDPDHAQDLKHFRAKSKSWAGKHHKKLSVRNLSRLGF